MPPPLAAYCVRVPYVPHGVDVRRVSAPGLRSRRSFPTFSCLSISCRAFECLSPHRYTPFVVLPAHAYSCIISIGSHVALLTPPLSVLVLIYPLTDALHHSHAAPHHHASLRTLLSFTHPHILATAHASRLPPLFLQVFSSRYFSLLVFGWS